MGYTITFADVMAGVITLALGLISYFIKNWFADMGKANERHKILNRVSEWKLDLTWLKRFINED